MKFIPITIMANRKLWTDNDALIIAGTDLGVTPNDIVFNAQPEMIGSWYGDVRIVASLRGASDELFEALDSSFCEIQGVLILDNPQQRRSVEKRLISPTVVGLSDLILADSPNTIFVALYADGSIQARQIKMDFDSPVLCWIEDYRSVLHHVIDRQIIEVDIQSGMLYDGTIEEYLADPNPRGGDRDFLKVNKETMVSKIEEHRNKQSDNDIPF